MIRRTFCRYERKKKKIRKKTSEFSVFVNGGFNLKTLNVLKNPIKYEVAGGF